MDERSGAAEIQGLDDRTLIERFSKRSEQIDQAGRPRPEGIKASSAAAVATRAPKDHSESEQSVYQRWGHELAEQGWVSTSWPRSARADRAVQPLGRSWTRCWTRWPARTADRTGVTFIRAEVVDALAKRLPVAPSAQQALTQMEEAADRFLEERAVRSLTTTGQGRAVLDAGAADLERHLVDGATRARTGAAQWCDRRSPRVLDRHPSAGEDQAAMVRDLTQGGAGVAVVVGRAGGGKTWALGLAREAFELAGYQVHGTAPTGIATVGLAEEGFSDGRTVDRLLLDLQGAGPSWTIGRCWWWTRPPWSPPESSPPCSATPSGQGQGGAGRRRPPVRLHRRGGGFALRLRLGASELTVNRRQVEAWEQQAIDDVRAGNLEQAITAYAEHDRIRAFEARDDRDRALIGDWWQAHQAGEQPVIYATEEPRSTSSTRLPAAARQPASSSSAWWSGPLVRGRDVVVLGANARDRLGVVNGTTAVIQELDVSGRAMTVRTLEDEPPRTVRFPAGTWTPRCGRGSRAASISPTPTDMRSQGRTERRALLALDGAEDMQGGYVQLTRSTRRTDHA